MLMRTLIYHIPDLIYVKDRESRFLLANRALAELMGVPVGRTTVAVYALSGLLAGLAGIVFSLYTGAGYSLAATGVELDTITAVVIGGTQLTGGYGYVVGTFVGVLIQGLIQTYITFDGTLSSWWTKIAIGVLLFVFILLQKGLLTVWAGRGGEPLHAGHRRGERRGRVPEPVNEPDDHQQHDRDPQRAVERHERVVVAQRRYHRHPDAEHRQDHRGHRPVQQPREQRELVLR